MVVDAPFESADVVVCDNRARPPGDPGLDHLAEAGDRVQVAFIERSYLCTSAGTGDNKPHSRIGLPNIRDDPVTRRGTAADS